MDKLRPFDFLAVLMPGIVLTCFVIYLRLGNVIFEKDGIFISAIVLMLPLYLFIGHLLSVLGAFMEKIIDNGKKHPVIEIFEKYPDVEREMVSLFPPPKTDSEVSKVGDATNPTPTDNSTDIDYDYLFEKCRVLNYQQTYAEKAQSMSANATFYRNMVACFFVIFFVSIAIKWTNWSSHHIIVERNSFIFMLVAIVVLAIYCRYLSQKIYTFWFHEVLKNIDIYFKTLTHKK